MQAMPHQGMPPQGMPPQGMPQGMPPQGMPPQPIPPQGMPTQPSPAELDPLAKFRAYVPMMKKSLTHLMELAAQIFHQNSTVDTCLKSGDSSTFDRFDKCLEEFYAHCDQIELNLRLAAECTGQYIEAHKNTPQQITMFPQPPKSDGSGQVPETQQTFSQYLNMVRTQVNCAREIHDMLMECSKKTSERMPAMTTMQAPSSVGQLSGGQPTPPQQIQQPHTQ